MGSGLIFAGFLFLINPDFYTFDFLPDIIGYLLISAGLKKMSFLEERIATARRFLQYLVLVSAIKILSVPAVISTTVESTRLTVCFAFFVVELGLGFVCVLNALKGFQYLAIRKDGDLALKGFDTAKFFLTVFIFVKHIGNFLAPSAVIFFPNVDADPEVAETSRQSFMNVRNILFVVGAICVLAIGIYTARILKAYISRCREDVRFCENLKLAYDEKVANNAVMQTILSIKSAFLYFFIAFVFLADLYLDDIGVIPSFFFPLIIFFALRSLRRAVNIPSWWMSCSLLSAILSAVSYLYRLLRLLLIENVSDFGVSFVLDPVGFVLGILSSAVCILCAVFLVKAISSVASAYTSYRYRPYGIAILIAVVALCDIGFGQYRYPSTFAVLPSFQWVIWVISLYLHKKSLDEIQEEAEYHLM